MTTYNKKFANTTNTECHKLKEYFFACEDFT